MRNLMVAVASSVLVSLSPASANAKVLGAQSTVLPLLPFGTQPAVNVHINGRGPYLFLVDTGASGVARIDSSVVSALQLPTVGSTTASGATAGAAVQIRQVAVSLLSVGSRRYSNLTPLSRSYNTPGEYLPQIGGILALNLFERELLTIDFPRRQLRIEPGDLPPANGSTILDYEVRDGLVYVPVAIGGVRVTALLDTGTDRSLDLPASVVRQLRLADFPHPIGKAQGVTGQVGIAEVRIDGYVEIGEHKVWRPTVTFSDAFQFPIIGSAFLHGYAVTIDQRNHRVRLVGNACHCF